MSWCGEQKVASAGIHNNMYCRGGRSGVGSSQIFAVGGVAIFRCMGSGVGGDADSAVDIFKKWVAAQALCGYYADCGVSPCVLGTFPIGAKVGDGAW